MIYLSRQSWNVSSECLSLKSRKRVLELNLALNNHRSDTACILRGPLKYNPWHVFRIKSFPSSVTMALSHGDVMDIHQIYFNVIWDDWFRKLHQLILWLWYALNLMMYDSKCGSLVFRKMGANYGRQKTLRQTLRMSNSSVYSLWDKLYEVKITVS